MNDFETKAPMSGSNDDLRQQCTALQRQVTTLLFAMVILSGTLTVFLWRQARYARVDLEVLKQPASQVMQAFKQEKPIMDDFLVKLADFGKSHPDFTPILTKYKIQSSPVPAPATAAPAPASLTPTTAPAAATPAKK